MALSRHDVPAIYNLVVNSLSAHEADQRTAEADLAQREGLVGFCSCLLAIVADRRPGSHNDVRLRAAVMLRNSIDRYWRSYRYWRGRRHSNEISDVEKDHVRKTLLLNIRDEDDFQIFLHLSRIISKVATLDCPQQWPDLFSSLRQLVQLDDAFGSSRILMVLFRTLKELSTSVDQNDYAELTRHLLKSTWDLWSSDFCTVSQNLSMLAEQNDIDSVELPNDLIFMCQRWMVCSKILQQFIYSCYVSDSETTQEVGEVIEFCPAVLTCIEQLLPLYRSFKDKQSQSQLLDFTHKACTKLMKVLVTLQRRHPYSFCHEAVLPVTLNFCLNLIANTESNSSSFHELIMLSMIFVKSVLECKEYKPSIGHVVVKPQPSNLEQIKKSFAAVASHRLQAALSTQGLGFLFKTLIQRYDTYPGLDFEDWSKNLESFCHEQNLVQWTGIKWPFHEIHPKVQLFNFILVLLERVGPKVISAAVGPHSSRYSDRIVPILQSVIDVENPYILNLLKSGLLLWEAIVSSSVYIVAPVMDLFPHLEPMVIGDWDHLEVTMKIIWAYSLLGGSEFLECHGTRLANILDTVVGRFRVEELLPALKIIDLLIQSFPMIGPPLMINVIQKLIAISLSKDDGKDPPGTAVRVSSGAVLARLIVMNTTFALEVLSDVSVDKGVQGAGTVVNHNMLFSLVDMWIDKVDDANFIQQKAYVMALSVVLTLDVPQVIDRTSDILCAYSTVLIRSIRLQRKIDTSVDVTSSSWSGNESSDHISISSCEARKRHVVESDPIKNALLEMILTDSLKAFRALHGESKFMAAMFRIDDILYKQLMNALRFESKYQLDF